MFGALLAPAALSLVATTFRDPAERNKAFAIFGAIASSGASIGLILGGVLTQALDWRYSMYVNVVFAAISAAGALPLVDEAGRRDRAGLDLVSVPTVTGGLFGLVFGFAHAETASWTRPVTIGAISPGVALLMLFVLRQARVARPLLPLRVVLDRDRSTSFVSIAVVGAGIFAVLIFLTYYLQQIREFSPIATGVAYLLMTVSLVVASMLGNVVLRPRYGVRPVIATGMLITATGLLWLTRLDITSGYAGTVLPALLLISVGLGAIASSAFTTATAGVEAHDAGVAATVTASQQIGGSLGVAVLSTVAINAGRKFAAGRQAARVAAEAAMHGYTTAFAWAAGVFLAGAVLAALGYGRRAPAMHIAEASAVPGVG